MRGRALLMTAMTLALGAGAAAAREPEVNPGGASDAETKAFDLVGAAFAPISTLASPYSYITNPVCLFATTGETCSEASGPLYLSLPYGETLRQVPITLTFEYEGRIERLIGLRVRVTGPNIDRPSENIIGNNLSITSTETPSGRTRVEISNFYIPPMQLDPFDGEITLSIDVTAKVGESRRNRKSIR